MTAVRVASPAHRATDATLTTIAVLAIAYLASLPSGTRLRRTHKPASRKDSPHGTNL
jgi:hypothetical protein